MRGYDVDNETEREAAAERYIKGEGGASLPPSERWNETDESPRLTAEALRSELRQCCGSDGYERVGLGRKVVATTGAIFMAELAGAYWLLDAVASYQSEQLQRKCGGFQLWRLVSDGKGGCVLTCQADTHTAFLVRQEIEFTDFPLDDQGFSLFVEGDSDRQVILLPCEH